MKIGISNCLTGSTENIILFIAKNIAVNVMSIVFLMTVQSIFKTISTYRAHSILEQRLVNDLHILAYCMLTPTNSTYLCKYTCIHKLVCLGVLNMRMSRVGENYLTLRKVMILMVSIFGP